MTSSSMSLGDGLTTGGSGAVCPWWRSYVLEIFNILRKFTRSCAEKFLKKCFKSSFEQRCFSFFGSVSFSLHARAKEKEMNVKKKDFCFVFHPFFDTKNRVKRPKLFSLTDSVENQTFFTKSKILEKAVSQAQNDVFVPCRWIMDLYNVLKSM